MGRIFYGNHWIFIMAFNYSIRYNKSIGAHNFIMYVFALLDNFYNKINEHTAEKKADRIINTER